MYQNGIYFKGHYLIGYSVHILQPKVQWLWGFWYHLIIHFIVKEKVFWSIYLNKLHKSLYVQTYLATKAAFNCDSDIIIWANNRLLLCFLLLALNIVKRYVPKGMFASLMSGQITGGKVWTDKAEKGSTRREEGSKLRNTINPQR